MLTKRRAYDIMQKKLKKATNIFANISKTKQIYNYSMGALTMIKRCVKRIILGILKTIFGIMSTFSVTCGIWGLVNLNHTIGWNSVKYFFASIIFFVIGLIGFYIVGQKKDN